MNLIVYINTTFFMFKIPASIPQNLVIYHTKKLCHHMEHTLFYLCLNYGTIWKNIVSLVGQVQVWMEQF
jgi:hypothetical protein